MKKRVRHEGPLSISIFVATVQNNFFINFDQNLSKKYFDKKIRFLNEGERNSLLKIVSYNVKFCALKGAVNM